MGLWPKPTGLFCSYGNWVLLYLENIIKVCVFSILPFAAVWEKVNFFLVMMCLMTPFPALWHHFQPQQASWTLFGLLNEISLTPSVKKASSFFLQGQQFWDGTICQQCLRAQPTFSHVAKQVFAWVNCRASERKHKPPRSPSLLQPCLWTSELCDAVH